MSGEGGRSLMQLLDEIEGNGETTSESGSAASQEKKEAAPSENALSALLSSSQLLQSVGSLSALLSAQQPRKNEDKPEKPDARALLCALRPYLGGHRRTTIDSMLQMLQLYSILQALPLQQLMHKESK